MDVVHLATILAVTLAVLSVYGKCDSYAHVRDVGRDYIHMCVCNLRGRGTQTMSSTCPVPYDEMTSLQSVSRPLRKCPIFTVKIQLALPFLEKNPGDGKQIGSF